MADETKKEDETKKDETSTDEKLSFKTADELAKFLMDLQGQMVNMQETIDRLAPKEETTPEETTEETAEELSDDEVNEIDQLLQSE